MDISKGIDVLDKIIKYITFPKIILCLAVIALTVLLFIGIKLSD